MLRHCFDKENDFLEANLLRVTPFKFIGWIGCFETVIGGYLYSYWMSKFFLIEDS